MHKSMQGDKILQTSLNRQGQSADKTNRQMNADEKAVQDFLKDFPGIFVSVSEISRRLGARRKYLKDRLWARPILRRMELDGHLESNAYGEYRLKCSINEKFVSAINKPGVSLGETTLISFGEGQEGED